MRVAAIAIYVVVMVGGIVAINGNAENGEEVFLAWSAASLLLGWVVRNPIAIVLPLLAVPIAVPFGSAEKWLGSDAPSILVAMAFWGPIQVVIVAVGCGAGLLNERFWWGRRGAAPNRF